nr:MAG: hypothetical protein [Microvirus sp.]
MKKSELPLKPGNAYRTSGNYSHEVVFGGEYETPEGISCTVPDQSLTVQQLLQRHARGQALRGYEPIYYNDLPIPAIENMDFAERKAFLEHIRTHRKEIEDIIEAEKSEAEKAQAKKDFEDQLEKAILARQTDPH